MSATGFAVRYHGQIDVRTVSTSRRETVVAWLARVKHAQIRASNSDQEIQHAWDNLRGTAVVIMVNIEDAGLETC